MVNAIGDSKRCHVSSSRIWIISSSSSCLLYGYHHTIGSTPDLVHTCVTFRYQPAHTKQDYKNIYPTGSRPICIWIYALSLFCIYPSVRTEELSVRSLYSTVLSIRHCLKACLYLRSAIMGCVVREPPNGAPWTTSDQAGQWLIP